MDLLRISLVQFEVVWENPLANKLKLESLLAPLKGQSDLILLPEMFTTGFSMNVRELSESMEGDTVKWMRELANKSGSALAGSLVIEEDHHYYNRYLFVTPSGEINYYDKKHLFSMGAENQYFNPGNKRVIVDYSGWRIALFVCYDLRFPVWCRSIKDADLMLFTANWPDARKIVWQTLIKARAIENQLYVAGVNRIGKDGAGINYSGDSLIIDPKGNVLCDLAGPRELVATTTISLQELNGFRDKFPLFRDADSFDIGA
jgi:predicted amidohydrolase